MRRPRLWLPGAATGEVLELPADEAHHLVRVLRRKRGDEVLAVGGAGPVYRASIERIERDGRVWLRVGRPEASAPPPAVPWTVAVTPVKSRDMDLAVRLASEVGLERILPLESERSQVKAERSGKLERWRRVALESAKQCGRARPLEVAPAEKLADVLETPAGGTLWLVVPGGPLPRPQSFCGPQHVGPATFLIGPEGGFTEGEVRRSFEAGARALGFPTPTLRTPTAVLFVAVLGVLLPVIQEQEETADEPDSHDHG